MSAWTAAMFKLFYSKTYSKLYFYDARSQFYLTCTCGEEMGYGITEDYTISSQVLIVIFCSLFCAIDTSCEIYSCLKKVLFLPRDAKSLCVEENDLSVCSVPLLMRCAVRVSRRASNDGWCRQSLWSYTIWLDRLVTESSSTASLCNRVSERASERV